MAKSTGNENLYNDTFTGMGQDERKSAGITYPWQQTGTSTVQITSSDGNTTVTGKPVEKETASQHSDRKWNEAMAALSLRNWEEIQKKVPEALRHILIQKPEMSLPVTIGEKHKSIWIEVHNKVKKAILGGQLLVPLKLQ
ncbi:MAG: hypothetical protein SFU25_08115 [Candidatus Caenarcaniphilales bacterium]|nr:hypothetical protein [Candidatus Caenarcaniphilales bacterium]